MPSVRSPPPGSVSTYQTSSVWVWAVPFVTDDAKAKRPPPGGMVTFGRSGSTVASTAPGALHVMRWNVPEAP